MSAETQQAPKMPPIAATPQEAYDEALRELQVRKRCFPKWVQEGKLARSDARDRLARQAMIVEILESHPDVIRFDANAKEDYE